MQTANMDVIKPMNKHLKQIGKELRKISSYSNSIRLRRHVKEATHNLHQVADFVLNHEKVIKSWKMRNHCLAHAVQNEKERSSKLLQEKIELQAAYHDILKDKAILKKELYELEQSVMADSGEFQNTLDKLVDFSNDYSVLTVKYSALQNKIKSKRDRSALPRNFFGNINFGTNSNQPVSAVNPMIKGCVIQKPTINVRRLPFPNEPRSSLFEYVDISSPIMEEPEETVNTSTTVPRRCESGLRQLINVSNRRARRRLPQPVPVEEINYDGSATETESEVNVRMEPVVRLEDVTRMLQNSSLRISEPEDSNAASQSINLSRTVHCSPEVKLNRIPTPRRPSFTNGEDALEGSSWMYERSSPARYRSDQRRVSSHKSPSNNRPSPTLRRQSLFEADSSNFNLNESHSQSYGPRNLSSVIAQNGVPGSERRKKLFISPSRSPLLGTRKKRTLIHLNEPSISSPRNSNVNEEWPSEILCSSTPDRLQEDSEEGAQRRKRQQRKCSSRFSETKLDILADDFNLSEVRPSTRLRKSVRLSMKSQDVQEQSKAKKRCIRPRKTQELDYYDDSNEEGEMTDTYEGGKSRASRRSKINSNVSSTSPNDAEQTFSSRPVRSVRNRVNISYEEPSMKRKLRR